MVHALPSEQYVNEGHVPHASGHDSATESEQLPLNSAHQLSSSIQPWILLMLGSFPMSLQLDVLCLWSILLGVLATDEHTAQFADEHEQFSQRQNTESGPHS